MNQIKSHKLKKNINFLKSCLNKQKVSSIIANANCEQRKCLYEILLNILNGNIPVNNNTVLNFKKKKKQLRLLVNKKYCEKKKKKIINQQGKGALLPLLIAVLPPIIDSIIKKLIV